MRAASPAISSTLGFSLVRAVTTSTVLHNGTPCTVLCSTFHSHVVEVYRFPLVGSAVWVESILCDLRACG